MNTLLLLLVLTSGAHAALQEGNEPKLIGGGGGIRSRIEVINLLGRLEAQDIDIANRQGCWEKLLQALSGACSSRQRAEPLTPIRHPTPPLLRRTDSYYPGRGQDLPDGF